jgi:hypothetical protein
MPVNTRSKRPAPSAAVKHVKRVKPVTAKKPILSDIELGLIVDAANRYHHLARDEQIEAVQASTVADTSEFEDTVFVRLTKGHLSWQFPLLKEELEHLKTTSEEGELHAIQVEGREIFALFSSLVDSVEEDQVEVARLVRTSKEVQPDFIKLALEEFHGDYVGTTIFQRKQLAEIVYELGLGVKPSTKISRQGEFVDSLMEKAAQAAANADKSLDEDDLAQWREMFADFVDDQYPEEDSDEEEEDEEDEEEDEEEEEE